MKTNLFKQTRRGDRNTVRSAAERYYAEHPGSPAAARQPRILISGGRYVALLGSSLPNPKTPRLIALSPQRSAVSTISTLGRTDRAKSLPGPASRAHGDGAFDTVMDKANAAIFLATDRGHVLREAIMCCCKDGAPFPSRASMGEQSTNCRWARS